MLIECENCGIEIDADNPEQSIDGTLCIDCYWDEQDSDMAGHWTDDV